MPSRLLLESHTYLLGLIRVIVTTKTHALLVSFKSSDMTHYVHRSVSLIYGIVMLLQMSMVRRNMLFIINTLHQIKKSIWHYILKNSAHCQLIIAIVLHIPPVVESRFRVTRKK